MRLQEEREDKSSDFSGGADNVPQGSMESESSLLMNQYLEEKRLLDSEEKEFQSNSKHEGQKV